MSDLQSSIVIDDNEITGALNYITGYTGFSSDPDFQSGNFLALKVATNRTGAITTVEVTNGTSGPVQLDSDMNIVLKIADPETQSIKIITTKDGDSLTKTYGLTGLTCEAEPEPAG